MPDHIAVTARAYFAEEAERGTGLDSVSEAIYESPAVQSKTEAIAQAILRNPRRVSGSPGTTHAERKASHPGRGVG